MYNQYFALKPAKECVDALETKITDWENKMISSGLADKVRNSANFYFGAFNNANYDYSDHKITFGGDQGELAKLPVNHYRNIAQHLLNMITTNRPALQARATNTDYRSLTQVTLANGLLDYYMREKYLEDVIKKAAEYAIVLSEGWVKLDWDATGGEEYTFDEERQNFIYSGDIKYKALTIFDVIRDVYKDDESDHEWYIVKGYKNKYDLAAKYPDQAEEILKTGDKQTEYLFKLGSYQSKEETCEIPVYEFFHKKTDSIEQGRYILFINSKCILIDMPMPYRMMPIYKIQPSSMFGTPFGYTPMFDLIPLQEAINMLYSIILTNQNAFGVQNVLLPRGSDINFTQLAGGLNILEYNPGLGEPKPLQLTQTPAEIFGMIDRIQEQMETISGVNSVIRGNPEASLRSGNALALIQANSVQFLSGLQQSYVRLTESCGTGTIKFLQDFASVPRIAAIVGKSNEPYLKEFVGKDLMYINRVVVDVSNPISKTTGGRLEMAGNLLQYGAIKDPYQYLQVLNTGKLESMTENSQKELLLISKENEALLVGKEVMTIDLDSHLNHIKEHKALLFDPDLRSDPRLVQNTLRHIQEHIDALKQTDPNLLMLLGEQPLPPPMPPEGQAPPEGAPAPQGDQGSNPQLQEPAPTGVEAAQQVQGGLPQPPGQFANMPLTTAGNIPQ